MHRNREADMSESVTFYKLRHKPSGLYFRTYETGKHTNLSRVGKVYQTRPSMAYVQKGYYGLDKRYVTYEDRKTCIAEWEIVTYEAIEVRPLQ